jgi:hypothetical protein
VDLALVAGVWAIALLQLYHVAKLWGWLDPPYVPKPEGMRPNGPLAARAEPEPAWSPEGWGAPDSEVISTEGDDYLARMHRPRRGDDEDPNG